MNTAKITALAEDVYLRRLQDYVGLRDYALSSNGAELIAEWCSPTRKGAIKALQPEQYSCWPFAGSLGHLAVKLSKPVHVRSITIDHIPPSLSLDISTAPREMKVWGQVNDGAVPRGHNFTNQIHKIYAPRGYVFAELLSFEYQIHGTVHIQQFNLPLEVLSLNLLVEAVVLEIRSNWGSATHTCIYRLRVHAEE